MKNKKNSQISRVSGISVKSNLHAGKVQGCKLVKEGKNGRPNKYWCCNMSGYCWPEWAY